MEDNFKLLKNLAVPSLEIKLETLQETLAFIQKSRLNKSNTQENWNETVEVLWQHIDNGLSKIDDQLLCATCFYNALTIIEKKEFYLHSISKIIDTEIELKTPGVTDGPNISKVLSLMYGIFQSSLLSYLENSYIALLKELLNKTLTLLMLMANDYSRYTFIVFKIISSFKKLCQTVFEESIFNRENQIKLLNLTCHNWENPITGIRDLNKSIFQTLITVANKNLYYSIVNELNAFMWNKAKYLMLAEIITEEKKSILQLVAENPDWIEGLFNSLGQSGLVSAGADMYYAILKKLKSDEDWVYLFLTKILIVLNGDSFKAKENFNNYWLLTTMKTYPAIYRILCDRIFVTTNVDENDNLYGMLSIIKQGNRLGLLYKNWDEFDNDVSIINLIFHGMRHNNPYIRMLAFDIVCVSQGTAMPTVVEFNIIYTFLTDNINSDCTVLRLSMLNSLKFFLKRLHVLFLNMMKHNDGHENDHSLYEFCRNIQNFIANSLNTQGNYQRKITVIKVCEIIFTSFSEIPRNKRDKCSNVEKTLIQTLKENNIWILSDETFIKKLITLLKDPADDVQEIVVQMLSHHYSTDLIKLKIVESIIEEIFESIKSDFFYRNNLGQKIFKLLTSLLINNVIEEMKFNKVEDIFHFVCNELINEYKTEKDILISIENGRQLHGFVTVLIYILQVCLQNKYAVDNMFQGMALHELLGTLEAISNQFVMDEENAAVSYDFSKMNDMVNNIIEKSGHDPYDKSDKTKISGLHQTVLNTMWLNVKTSCELAAILIKCHRHDKDIEVSKKCLGIITHVLDTSRHKGAIEAAGAALGQSIQHLTSLSNDSELSKLPEVFLKCKLDDLIYEANVMASVTRRGAGLSIMVHRIVSHDMKKGKPLFHYFMNVLIETCRRTEDVPNFSSNHERDLPKAMYIHFLTRIVFDSTLSSDIMYYSASLGEIAFDHLTNQHWQIRNAALQLYGALVPKLIGQKKSSSDEEETLTTVACDEFRTHSTKLWKYMQQQFQTHNCIDKIQGHSNLVPILNILSNCAKRYNFTLDSLMQDTTDMVMFENLINLLNSPIYTVRRLTAKCIYNIYSFELIFSTILGLRPLTENFLHGLLILINIYYKQYSLNGLYKHEFIVLQEYFNNLRSIKQPYLCRALLDDMFLDFKGDVIENVRKVLQDTVQYRHEPGVFTWANTVLKKYFENCKCEILPKLVKLIVNHNDVQLYFSFLYKRLKSDKYVPNYILNEIFNILLLSYRNKFESHVIWKILYKVSLNNVILYEDVHLSVIFHFLEENNYKVAYKIRYLIPLAARICCNHNNNFSWKLHLSNAVFLLTNVEEVDVDMRYIAVLANNEFGNGFANLAEDIKIIVIKSAIVLLQDEDEEVRNSSVYFYKNMTKCKHVVQPYICLQKLMDYDFLKGLFVNVKSCINTLCDELYYIIQEYFVNSEKKDECNPFANDSRNIYFESEILKQFISELRQKNEF